MDRPFGVRIAVPIQMAAASRSAKGVYDNEPALASRRGDRATPTEAFDRFWGVLGMGTQELNGARVVRGHL